MSMRFIFRVIILALHSTHAVCAWSIQTPPVCSVYTPHSILEHTQDYRPLFVGGRSRYATCSGVAWFHDTYLAVLNLLGRTITVYAFDESLLSCTLVQQVTDRDGMRLVHAENITISPDGTLLSVCSDAPYSGVMLYRIDRDTHCVRPQPLCSIEVPTGLIHNTRFSPDGRYLATAGWDPRAALCIYQVDSSHEQVRLRLVHSQAEDSQRMKAKGICFTRDGRFAVVCYSVNLSGVPSRRMQSALVVYPFDASRGTLLPPVFRMPCTMTCASFEDVALADNDRVILVTNQCSDCVVIYHFDPVTGQIDSGYTLLDNPRAHLSFPHGLGISPDGNYVAVTSYGDDKFTVYRTSGFVH